MSIKAGNGTSVVLQKRRVAAMDDGPTRLNVPVVSLATVDITYEGGKKFVFYIEDQSLLEFIRESINRQHFRSTEGERVPLI